MAATPAELAQLQWLYQADTSKIVIIPPGVDISHFYPIPPDEAKEFIGIPPCDTMLLFVGRIEPFKGIDTLIKAISLMRSEDVNVCLSVIGGDPNYVGDQAFELPSAEMKRLQAMCEDAGLGDMVAFLGKRSQDTLPYYYSAAEAVVMPSHYEFFGMVALEAMACGTPVVASEVGGLPFLVQDGITGFTMPADDPHALADRLTTLINDPKLRKKMGTQATALAQEYAWEEIAARVAALYKVVIQEGAVLD